MESNKRSIIKSQVLAFGSVGAADQETLTTPVNGAKVGQPVVVSCGTLEDGLICSGFVSAAGVVSIKVLNVTGAPVDPANTHRFDIAVL